MRIKCKLFVVVPIVAVLLSSASWALTPLGPPKSGLKQKQYSLGFVYASSEMDLEVGGYGFSWTATDIDWKTYLARLGYGLSDDCEIYSLLGFSKCSSDDFNGSTEFAWGFGTKFTVAKNNSVTWGGMFQLCSMSSEDSATTEDPYFGYTSASIDVQLFDIQIAFGPTYTKEAFSIYGGPFLHFVDGDLEVRANGDSGSVDIEQESEFGGYVGAQFDVDESASVFIEYQMTGDASAIAGGFVWRF
ncbi:MAG TPA: hypothetical protein VMW72_06040 [Sedimentisphaerales bacterium]|nr:hypothetical protein [Sedimentisphaerales bacterium]